MDEFTNLAPVFATLKFWPNHVDVIVHHTDGTGDIEIARLAMKTIKDLVHNERANTGREIHTVKRSRIFEPGVIRNTTTYRYSVTCA